MGKSTKAQKETLERYTANGAYLGLFTNDPGDDGDGDELNKSGYARQFVPSWTQPRRVKALMQTENVQAVEFPPIAGGYGTITHVALFDTADGADMSYHTELNNTIRSTSDDKGITFPAGDLKVAED